MPAAPLTTPDLEASVEVDCDADEAWRLVSDVTRTPEWSPVVRHIEWIDGSAAAVPGARFRGDNRFNGFRWSRECEVTEAEPGRRFAFSTTDRDGREQTRWRYDLEEVAGREGRTRIRLAYQIVSMPRWVRVSRRLPGGRATNERQARKNLDDSLERIRSLLAG